MESLIDRSREQYHIFIIEHYEARHFTHRCNTIAKDKIVRVERVQRRELAYHILRHSALEALASPRPYTVAKVFRLVSKLHQRI